MPNETHPLIIDPERLKRISGKSSPAAVRRWARDQGIKFKDGAKGPWTTVDAINISLGIAARKAENYRPEDVL
jgi:hypothetical protein